ncbi:efflux RND transporter periplasmic adaptor subunit [Calycomorphotria hydatis]|uniref:Multidrug resistance protein MdtN n=1 Tax=Calycomorphotria hydatis TaxID=2528027 RepID=A0A517T933_9PLAN|nr:HlyD family efflux transporter periplasmic adaptor subunit [Calycomorphotria hydatis]QDT64859.1 multidrug resistance protein MdtN [Calycomorphotria hydatis]
MFTIVTCYSRRIMTLSGLPAFVVSTLFWGAALAEEATVIELHECRIVPDKTSIVAFGSRGAITDLLVEEGDQVKQGDLLAHLFDEEVRAMLMAAEKEANNDVSIRFAQKAAELAQVEYEQVVLGNQRTPGTFPPIEVRRLKMEAERRVLEIEQAEHERDMARHHVDEMKARLKSLHVTAPFDGFVTRILKREGEAVQEGEPLLELVNTNQLRVEGFLNAEDLPHVHTGALVNVIPELSKLKETEKQNILDGQLIFVDQVVQPVTYQARVWARVENHDGLLRSGLTATMLIRESTSGVE